MPSPEISPISPHSTPEPGLLLCALSGPVSDEENAACHLALGEEPGLIRQRRRFYTEKRITWRALRSFYLSDSALREAADRLEQWRDQQEQIHGLPNYGFNPELLISRARYALITGQEKKFGRLYSAYTQTLQALSEPPHYSFFWEQVLGPGLEGAAEVSGETAREQLAHLISSHYACSAYPADSLVCGRDVDTGQPTDLLYELRSADRAALSRRLQRDRENSLAAAALCMLQGQWKEACRLFDSCLPNSLADFPSRAEGEMGIFFLYASICAIKAGAPPGKCSSWISLARRSIDFYLDSSYAPVSVLVSVLDHLEWVAGLFQHTGTGTSLSQEGGVALVPLLWGAIYQMPSQRNALSPSAFPARIRKLQQSGLLLAAAYAVNCALCLAPRDGDVHTQLLEIQRTLPPVAPLADPASVPVPGELQKRILEEWADACTPPQMRLYWDLTLDEHESSIRSIEMHLAAAPELTGRLLSPLHPFRSDLEDLMDDYDRKTAPLRQAQSYSTGCALREVSCLIGHPRVRVMRDGEYHPVTVRGKLPELQIKREGNRVSIYQEAPRPPHRLIESTDTSITLPLFTKADELTRERFRIPGKTGAKRDILTLESPEPLHLQELLARLSQGFDIKGDLLPANLPLREAAPELLVELCLKRRALCPRLLLRLLPESPYLVQPGTGLEQTLLPVGNDLVYVHRPWKTERELVSHLLAQCPDLHPIQPGTFPLLLHALRGERSQLRLMQQLQAAGVRIIWAGDKRLSVFTATRDQLTFTVGNGLPGWLEIGGQLKVDEQRIISLTALLESTLQTDRMILEDGTRILADEQLITLLRRLKVAHTGEPDSSGVKGDTIRLCHAALPSVCDVGKGLLPEALLRKCPDLSERKWHVPAELHATLRDYQLEGYRWMCTRAEAGIGMCLADDMGLGKTIQTLALLLKRASGGAALVIAPLSLLSNWIEEARRFAPTLQVQLYVDWDDTAPLPPHCLMLASYGQLTSAPERARSLAWHTLVLDEAQSIRNHSTQRAKAVRSLRAKARVALTGTPIENGLGDLWSIMEFLNPGLLGSLRAYRNRYRSNDALPALHSLVRSLILRRTRQQVLPQLPELTEIEWKVTLTPEERALYEAARRRALDLMEKKGTTAHLFAELTRLRRACCHGKLAAPGFKGKSSKLDALLELLTELHSSGHKALVFSQFTDVLDLVEPMLDKEDIHFLRLDGTTTAKRRTRLIEQFQQGKADCFLISLKAGGVGLNLTAASYVILLDPWWNPAVESQAAARSHRLGQTQPVTLYRLIAENTVEERVLALHQSKKKLAEALITEGTLPLAELRALLKG